MKPRRLSSVRLAQRQPKVAECRTDKGFPLAMPDGSPCVRIDPFTLLLTCHPDNLAFLRAEMARSGFDVRIVT